MFDGDLKPFLRKGKGEAYIKDSQMRQSGTWVTETEILAMAKMMRWDVFMYTNTRWQRFPYKLELSWDAFYIDNRGGACYEVVLKP